MREVQAALVRIEVTAAEIKAMLAATIPHLATRAEVADLRVSLAEKPGKLCMWGILGVLIATYAAGLAGFAILR